MKKNMLCKLILLIFSAVAVPFSFFNAAPHINADNIDGTAAVAPVSMDYVEYLINGEDDGYAPEAYDLSLYSANMQKAIITEAGKFPPKYDLRDYGLVSPVKNQGVYGTCWAFTAMSSIETQLIAQKPDIDLSEWHLAYFTYTGDDEFVAINNNIFMEGGHNNCATALLSQWVGPVFEQTVPYESQTPLDEDLKTVAEYHVQDVYNVDCWMNDQKIYPAAEIKQLLMEGNSVSASCAAAPTIMAMYYNPYTFAAYCNQSIPVDHGITIVGWDDNYSKYNFNFTCQPKSNGAWIVKNSWSELWGDKGYYYISYEDKTLRDAACYFVEDKDNYSRNYQYDTFGLSTVITADKFQANPASYMSNIFTAKETENVSAVSFYTVEPDAKYEITIYSNLANALNPISGTPSKMTVGSEKYKGYHTVELDNPVTVEKGEKFSVVLKITNKTSPYVIPVEATIILAVDGVYHYSIDYNRMLSNGASGQSFISSNGTKWTDTRRMLFKYTTQEYFYFEDNKIIVDIGVGNVCLKAFTSPIETAVKGDINCSGTTDNDDIMLLEKFMLGIDILTEQQEKCADLNDDGNIDITDLTMLKELLLQLTDN